LHWGPLPAGNFWYGPPYAIHYQLDRVLGVIQEEIEL
jgi:hypothetical protein